MAERKKVSSLRVALKDLASMLQKEEMRALAVHALKDAVVNATRSYGIGDGDTKTEPDYKTRVHAAAIILSYTDGIPPKMMQLIVDDRRKGKSENERAEDIARALRLPAGRGIQVLEAKSREGNDAPPAP